MLSFENSNEILNVFNQFRYRNVNSDPEGYNVKKGY